MRRRRSPDARIERWASALVLALAACNAPSALAPDAGAEPDDAALADAGRDAGRDAAVPDAADVRADAAREDAGGVDAARVDAAPEDAGSDAGCTEAWCACSAWPGRRVGDRAGLQRLAVTGRGLALASRAGLDWLDATGTSVVAHTPWPAGTTGGIIDVVGLDDAIAVLWAESTSLRLDVVDTTTYALVASVPSPAPNVRSTHLFRTGAGLTLAWIDARAPWARRVARDGTLGTPFTLATSGADAVAVGDAADVTAIVTTSAVAPIGLWLQRVATDGAPLGAPIALGTGHALATGLATTAPAIVGNADGWFVAWAEESDDVPRAPFGPDVHGNYLVAHVAADGTVDGPPSVATYYWFEARVQLAVDPLGRAAVLTTLQGDAGMHPEVHFFARDTTRWRPALADPTQDAYYADLAYAPAQSAFEVAYWSLLDQRLWQICDLP